MNTEQFYSYLVKQPQSMAIDDNTENMATKNNIGTSRYLDALDITQYLDFLNDLFG